MRETASWLVVDTRTGRAVFETFDAKTAADVAAGSAYAQYEVVPILEWLQRLNQNIRNGE